MSRAVAVGLPRLGRLQAHPPEHPHHRLAMARYLAPGLVPAASVEVPPGATFDDYGNLAIGDCAEAAPANLDRAWRPGMPAGISLAAVVAAYTSVAGYDPSAPETDTGSIISDVLVCWSTSAIGGIGGNVLAAFGELDHASPFHFQLSVTLFGGAIVGVALPNAAKGATAWTTPTNLDGDNLSGSWGGHCVPIVGYDAGGAWVVTWGSLLYAEWGWLAAYCDEAWACVSADYQGHPGVDLAAMRAELAQIRDNS